MRLEQAAAVAAGADDGDDAVDARGQGDRFATTISSGPLSKITWSYSSSAAR